MSENDNSLASSAPESSQPPAPGGAGGLDLSALKSLSFGPDWSSTPSTDALVRKVGGRGDGKPGERGSGRGRDFGGSSFGAPPRRDRRPARATNAESFAPAPGAGRDGGNAGGVAIAPEAPGTRPRFSGGQTGGSRPPRRDGPGGDRGERGERRFTPPPFRPTHDVLFYPDDAAFRALLKAIRASCRTYELFEVAQLILQKPERFVVVITPCAPREGSATPVYVAQPDLLPFDSEEEAVAHVFDKHLDRFCVVEEIEVEPPKGNFVGVSRCGITGELLGPPNYHRYPQMLREHHARRLSRMPFDKFTSRIELVKEPEQIAAWIEKMKKTTRYKLKNPVEGAPEFFETLDAARQFLLGRSKDAIVRALDTVRYPGRMIEQFPPGNLRRSVETLLEQQRRFPLDTANNLRGRLRRMKFHLYKRGAKGVSYICAVKRRFRDPQTVLADHVQKLITYIEQHPRMLASRLLHDFLGLPMPEKAAAKPEAKAAEPAAPSAETATPSAETAAADGTNGTHTTDAVDAEVSATAPGSVEVPSASTEGTSSESAAQPEVAAAKPETQNTAPAAAAPTAPETLLTPEQQLQLRELVINLRWLVTEGYVIEYGDGRLFASPPLPAPKPKVAGEAAAATTDGDAESAAESGDEEIIEDTGDESENAEADAEGADFVEDLSLPVETTPPEAEITPPTEPDGTLPSPSSSEPSSEAPPAAESN